MTKKGLNYAFENKSEIHTSTQTQVTSQNIYLSLKCLFICISASWTKVPNVYTNIGINIFVFCAQNSCQYHQTFILLSPRSAESGGRGGGAGTGQEAKCFVVSWTRTRRGQGGAASVFVWGGLWS